MTAADYKADTETVIGLEVHAQLRTQSKLFSDAPVLPEAAPNSAVSPLCLALPGALPVLNEAAVTLALRACLALGCQVHEHSVFARKNYFYPDLPKGYQISQFEEPLATGGFVELEEGRRIRLTRIHMEEDAGRSQHDRVAGATRLDLNRCGVPLVEIVSEPDLRGPEEVSAYLRALQEILRYAGASDADMEKGQFRCDVNLSLRPRGSQELGTRTEIKNLNSFRFAEAAARAEVERQRALLARGEAVQQATLGYDGERGLLFTMRVKENADDYRYFPDPDLPPLQISAERIEKERQSLPELPAARRHRFTAGFGLAPGDARALTRSRALADYFESTAAALAADANFRSGADAAGAEAQAGGDGANTQAGGAAEAPGGAEPRAAQAAQLAANWVRRDVLALLAERGAEIESAKLRPAGLAQLIALVQGGRTSARSGRALLAELLFAGGDPAALVSERGLEVVADPAALEALADEALRENPKAAASYAAGDGKALNFLMGQVMQKSRGKADPARAREIIQRKLEQR